MPSFGQNAGMPEGKVTDSRFRALPLLCASLTVLLGLMTFVGWISGLPLLASVRAKYIPMAPSTALCFSLLGLGLLLHLQRPARRWISRLLTAVVLIIACAKLVEVLTGLRFGIDAWFVRKSGNVRCGSNGSHGADDGTQLCFHGLRSLCVNWS